MRCAPSSSPSTKELSSRSFNPLFDFIKDAAHFNLCIAITASELADIDLHGLISAKAKIAPHSKVAIDHTL